MANNLVIRPQNLSPVMYLVLSMIFIGWEMTMQFFSLSQHLSQLEEEV